MVLGQIVIRVRRTIVFLGQVAITIGHPCIRVLSLNVNLLIPKILVKLLLGLVLLLLLLRLGLVLIRLKLHIGTQLY